MRARSVLARVIVATTTVAALSLSTGTAAYAAPAGITVNDVSIAEGDAGTSTLTFTIVYGGAAVTGATVNYATVNGTATAGSDYVAKSGTAALAHGGCKCATVNVTVNGDTAAEGDETLSLQLSSPVGKTLDDNQATGVITDDDQPGASISDASVSEDAGALVFDVSLDATAPYDSTLGYTSTAGTATAGSDFTNVTDVLTIASGSTDGTISVPIVDDSTYEGDETFTVALSIVSGISLVDNQATGTIVENDPTPSVTANDPNVAESDATMTFAISLNTTAAVDVDVDYATSDNTAAAGADYTAASGSATITAGTTSTTVDVPVLDDAVYEGDETLNLQLTGAVNGSIVDAEGQGTITEDDTAPNITVDDPSVAENNGPLTFTVSLDAVAGIDVSVDYASAAGTAAAGADFDAVIGTATVPAGSTSTTVDVPVTDDALYEGDETLSLDLSNEVNGALADAGGEGTITEDDAMPTISVDDPTVAEDNGPLGFTISLDAPAGVDVIVDVATTDGSATAGTDYTAKSGTRTILTGTTAAAVNVQVSDDAVYEGDETLTLDLSDGVNGTVGGGSGTGTITDDEAAPTVSVDDPNVAENAGPMTFTVSIDVESASDVSVDFATADGTATDGPDYAGYSGTATIAAGSIDTTVDVPVVDDAVSEDDETFALDLSDATVATIGTAHATGTITDDDAPPAVSIADATVIEGNTGTKNLSFSVSLSTIAASDVSVDYATADGTATAPGDYATAGGTLTIAAGQTTGHVVVAVNGDNVREGNETLTVTLSDLIGATTIDDGTATGTITNDDKQASTLTLHEVTRHGMVKARGLLEPASTANRVKIVLAKHKHHAWVNVSAKTVNIKKLADRDNDGKADAKYGVPFPQPAHGRYRFIATFAGDANTGARSTLLRFRV